jgi:hypothetical protein
MQGLTSWAIRDVRLAVVPHNGAIRISHHKGIEVRVASALEEADCRAAEQQQKGNLITCMARSAKRA